MVKKLIDFSREDIERIKELKEFYKEKTLSKVIRRHIHEANFIMIKVK